MQKNPRWADELIMVLVLMKSNPRKLTALEPENGFLEIGDDPNLEIIILKFQPLVLVGFGGVRSVWCLEIDLFKCNFSWPPAISLTAQTQITHFRWLDWTKCNLSNHMLLQGVAIPTTSQKLASHNLPPGRNAVWPLGIYLAWSYSKASKNSPNSSPRILRIVHPKKLWLKTLQLWKL